MSQSVSPFAKRHGHCSFSTSHTTVVGRGPGAYEPEGGHPDAPGQKWNDVATNKLDKVSLAGPKVNETQSSANGHKVVVDLSV